MEQLLVAAHLADDDTVLVLELIDLTHVAPDEQDYNYCE